MAEGIQTRASRTEVMVGSLLIMLALGTLLAMTVVLRPVYARFGESSSTGMVPAVLAFLFFGLVLVMSGKNVRSMHPAKGASLGGLLMGLGFLAGAGALVAGISFWAVAIPMGVLTGAGAGLAFASTLNALMRWFPESRGSRSGFALAAFFIGALIFSSVAGSLMVQGVDSGTVELANSDMDSLTDVDPEIVDEMIEEDEVDLTEKEVDDLFTDTGKRADREETLRVIQDGAYARFNAEWALAVMGIAVIFLCFFGARFIELPPEGWTPDGWEPADGGLSLQMTYRYGELVKERIFIQLWLMMAAGASMGLMLIFHMQGFAAHFGISTAISTNMLLLFLLGAAIGAYLAGSISDALSVPTVLFILFIFQAALLWILLDHVQNPYEMMWAMAFYGLCFGGILALFPAAAADYFGTQGFLKNYGLLLSSLGASALFGILLVAYVVSDDGNFDTSLFVVTAPSLVAALLAYVTKDPEKKLKAAARREAMEGEAELAEMEVRARKKERRKKAKKRKRKKKRK